MPCVPVEVSSGSPAAISWAFSQPDPSLTSPPASARAALSNASFAEAMPDDSIPASRATRDCAGLRRALTAALALAPEDAAPALHPLLFPEPALAHVTAQAE